MILRPRAGPKNESLPTDGLRGLLLCCAFMYDAYWGSPYRSRAEGFSVPMEPICEWNLGSMLRLAVIPVEYPRLVPMRSTIAGGRRAGRAVGATVQSDKAREPLFHRFGQGVIGGAHIGEHRPALGRGDLQRVQHREQRQHLLIGRIGVPVGGAFDAVPVDVAVRVDIAKPRDLGMFFVPVADERMDARRAEPASENGDIAGAEVLVAEHQHRMLGEGVCDPGESCVVWFRTPANGRALVADVAGNLGVAGQIRLVAELRWRILRNHLRRKNSRLDLIGLIWAAIFSGIMVIGLSFAFCWGAYISISTGHYEWLVLLFWGIFLFWQAFPLFVAGFGATFEFRTLLRFPLSLTAFYLVGLAYGLADFAAIASICWLLAIAVGTGIATPPCCRLFP